MSWFSERRLDFIEDQLLDHGQINRPKLVDRFGISPGQAGEDIAAYMKANRAVVYDARRKVYRWAAPEKAKAVRRSTVARRLAWAAF